MTSDSPATNHPPGARLWKIRRYEENYRTRWLVRLRFEPHFRAVPHKIANNTKTNTAHAFARCKSVKAVDGTLARSVAGIDGSDKAASFERMADARRAELAA